MTTTNDHATVTHPLGRRWTLWFDNPSCRHTNDNFGDTLRSIYTVGTVEDFWRIHHNVTSPGSLKPNCDIHLFKEGPLHRDASTCTKDKAGVAPKWEDPSCENGGRWTIGIPKGKNQEKLTNEAWLDAMLACIGIRRHMRRQAAFQWCGVRTGEMFNEMDDICGVACNIRAKGNRICLWTSSSDHKEMQLLLGQQFKEFLEAVAPEKISYLSHNDAKRITQSVRVSDLYVV